MKKAGVDKKTKKEKIIEVKPNYRRVPLTKLALVCDKCGYELPVLKIKEYSPVFCPKGCEEVLGLRIIGNLSADRWSNSGDNLKVADRFIIKRIK